MRRAASAPPPGPALGPGASVGWAAAGEAGGAAAPPPGADVEAPASPTPGGGGGGGGGGAAASVTRRSGGGGAGGGASLGPWPRAPLAAAGPGTAGGTAAALPALDAATLKRGLETSLDRWAAAASEAAEGVTSGRAVALDALREVAAQLVAALRVAWRPEAPPPHSSLAAATSVALYALACSRPLSLTVLVWIAATYAAGAFVIFFLFRLLGSPNSLSTVMHLIGLSLAPLTVLEPLMTLLETPLPVLGYAVKALAVLWAARTASVFLVTTDTSSKAFLFAYPCVLLHVYMLNLRR